MTELRTLRALLSLLSASERRGLAVSAVLLAVSGGLEIVGIGAVFVFTGVLNDLSTGAAVSVAFWDIDAGFASLPPERLALLGGLALILVFAFKGAILLFIQSTMMRVIFNAYRRFSVHLLGGYLRAPLTYHIEHGLADIQRNLNIQTAAVFNVAATSLAYVASNLIAIGCLFAVLCLIDPFASLLALLLQAAVGALYYAWVRRRLLAFGRQRHAHAASAIRWVGHAISGIREVRLLGAERFFLQGFEAQVGAIAAADRNSRVVAFIPGVVNELALIVGIVGLMLFYLSSGRNLPELMPTLAAFGFAGVRIMGMAASIVSHVQQLQFHGPAVQSIYAVAKTLDCGSTPDTARGSDAPSFARDIRLSQVAFWYPGASHAAFSNIDLEIRKGDRLAILGPSGSGKTTLLSILLGLLEPTTGAVLVDGSPVSADMQSWYAKLAYVPQTIFMLDATVRDNVLFGRAARAHDGEEDIWRALETAQVAAVVRNLPLGLGTVLGEGGAKLSGGERQRIGIARALLRQPELLVLDEATSALDRDTERKLLEAIHEGYPHMTIVIATHRIDAVRCYGRRFLLRGGVLTELNSEQERTGLEAATS